MNDKPFCLTAPKRLSPVMHAALRFWQANGRFARPLFPCTTGGHRLKKYSVDGLTEICVNAIQEALPWRAGVFSSAMCDINMDFSASQGENARY